MNLSYYKESTIPYLSGPGLSPISSNLPALPFQNNSTNGTQNFWHDRATYLIVAEGYNCPRNSRAEKNPPNSLLFCAGLKPQQFEFGGLPFQYNNTCATQNFRRDRGAYYVVTELLVPRGTLVLKKILPIPYFSVIGLSHNSLNLAACHFKTTTLAQLKIVGVIELPIVLLLNLLIPRGTLVPKKIPPIPYFSVTGLSPNSLNLAACISKQQH